MWEKRYLERLLCVLGVCIELVVLAVKGQVQF